MLRSRPFLLILLLALLATAAQTPQRVAAQNCSDDAELVEQSFAPPQAGDSATIAPDADFSITWKLRNTGDCTWSRTYRVIFLDGDRMEGARVTRLRESVDPDDTVKLTLELTAPDAPGSYAGTWQLRDAAGKTFGPQLTVEISVGDAAAVAGTTDVTLPEVLVFGGAGGAGDEDALLYCVVDGALPEAPALVVDYDALIYHYTTLYLCSLPEGAAITVTLTDPEGNTFVRDFVEDEAVTVSDVSASDLDGPTYTGTVIHIPLVWIDHAPIGDWEVAISGEDFTASAVLTIEAFGEAEFEYAQLDNWPTAPVDPFMAAEGCHYLYRPGQELMVSGDHLLRNTTLHVGVYQQRLGKGYLIDQFPVDTDADGHFVTKQVAWAEPGMYHLVLLQQITPEGFSEDGEQYDLGFAEDNAYTCLSVQTAEPPENPLLLAYTLGEYGTTSLEVMNLSTGGSVSLRYTSGNCDAGEPAWWPDEEWVVYQSNCIFTANDDGWIETSAAEDYDLYGSMVDFTYLVPEEDKLVRLTATPELNETEPDVNADGLIVYRETPVGASLDAVGDLHVLDVFEETDTPLNVEGRAPAWSPDGSRIAFMSDRDGSWQIYVYELASEKVWLVSRGCATHCRLPEWSPDGQEIIYHMAVADDDYTPSGVWIAPAKGITRARLFLEGVYGRPSWSSEGWIALQSETGIYRVTAETPPVVERYLLNDPDWAIYGSPIWSH